MLSCEETHDIFCQIFSVFFFKAAAYTNALLHSKLNSNTYWYSFDYRGPSTLFKWLFNNSPPPPPIEGGKLCGSIPNDHLH